MPRNKIANLAEDVELGMCWIDVFVFHACRVAGLDHYSNTLFTISEGWLWFF